MKDKTHDMNRGFSAEDAERGFLDPGKPELTTAAHKRRMEQGGLASNQALQDFENPSDGKEQPGGFLRRVNTGARR